MFRFIFQFGAASIVFLFSAVAAWYEGSAFGFTPSNGEILLLLHNNYCLARFVNLVIFRNGIFSFTLLIIGQLSP